jgi:mono/diheme cytochrome c family protein
MEEEGIRRPHFVDREMADLIAFLYSFRYSEPGGSPRVGEVLFDGRGCGRCHGDDAQGTALGPRLRGRGQRFTSVTLAAALWRHDPEMYERARKLGIAWPALGARDVGDLITFLNTAPETRMK